MGLNVNPSGDVTSDFRPLLVAIRFLLGSGIPRRGNLDDCVL